MGMAVFSASALLGWFLAGSCIRRVGAAAFTEWLGHALVLAVGGVALLCTVLMAAFAIHDLRFKNGGASIQGGRQWWRTGH